MQNPITKAIALHGGRVGRFAQALGVSYQAVRKWEQNGRPPAEQVLSLVRLMGGRMTPHDFRRDLYPDPEWMPDLEVDAGIGGRQRKKAETNEAA